MLCFAETGLVGYFLWTAMLLTTFVQVRALRRPDEDHQTDPEIRRWATGLQYAMIGFVTAAFFLSRTFVPLLYLLIGLSAALILIDRVIQLKAHAGDGGASA